MSDITDADDFIEDEQPPAPKAKPAYCDPAMPFGVHTGKRLSEIDVPYLDWLLGQSWLRPQLREQVAAHLAHRPEWGALEDES